MTNNDWDLLIGMVATTFGNKGELKVWPQTEHPERFSRLEHVWIGMPGSEGRVMNIKSVWFHKGAVIMKLAEVPDMIAAGQYRGAEVRIPASEIMPLPENEYYIHDIVGLEAVTTEGESLGTVREVLHSPANDVYVTDRAMIPAVKQFIEKIDLEGGKVIVIPMEGLVQD